jgi:hypothetical protein
LAGLSFSSSDVGKSGIKKYINSNYTVDIFKNYHAAAQTAALSMRTAVVLALERAKG